MQHVPLGAVPVMGRPGGHEAAPKMVSSRANLPGDVRDYYSLNARVYPKFAPFYDLVVAPIRRLRDEVVSAANAPLHSRVLDVATGTGEQACAFAAHGHTVVGLDISEAMLRRARPKARENNPTFQQGDAARLPFASGEFDVARISFALHEMPPSIREQALREMVRVTRRGGRLVIVDYGLPAGALAARIAYHAIKLYERDRGRAAGRRAAAAHAGGTGSRRSAARGSVASGGARVVHARPAWTTVEKRREPSR